MKTLAFVVLTIFTYLNTNNLTYLSNQQEQLTATFIGLTDDYYFEFKDEKGNNVVFNEISGDVDVNLFDEEVIGKKFDITWEPYTLDETDEDGEPTGNKIPAKRIIAMTEITE